MRAALYARFSSDLQNVGSIADQFAACRAHAARLGADVVAEYSDAAISGASAANRPGLIGLLAAAKAGAIDVVIAEALDRLTRSGGDAWDIYEDLRACNVTINTIAEGEAQTLHIGLKGTMNALFLEELARKTRRGLSGVARDGRSAGGRSYGYQVRRELTEAGEIRAGLRSIDPGEAAIVRRIFREYAAGASPRAIAGRLNLEGVPGPRGGRWNASTINGNAQRGNGVLHNDLYRGVQVWGRQTWTKDRRTGTRRARAAAEADRVTTAVPELRIVDDALWDAVQRRLASVAHPMTPGAVRRPKGLLSGLVRCGVCTGAMTLSGPDRRFRCNGRAEGSGCTNTRTARGADVEARVLAAIRDNLLHPAVIEAAVAEYVTEKGRQRAIALHNDAAVRRELDEVKRRAARLIDQVADGVLTGAAIKDRLGELETRRAALEARLDNRPSADVVDLHPAIAQRYRRLVEDLQAGLDGEPTVERAEARKALRTLIAGIRLIPAEGRGNYELELEGDLATLLRLNSQEEGVRVSMGAGTRCGRYPNSPILVKLSA